MSPFKVGLRRSLALIGDSDKTGTADFVPKLLLVVLIWQEVSFLQGLLI